MSSTPIPTKDDIEEIPPPERPPSPPAHMTFAARGVHVGDRSSDTSETILIHPSPQPSQRSNRAIIDSLVSRQ